MCVPVGLIHPHTFCFFTTIAHREEEDSQKCLNIALDKGIRPLFLNLVSHFSHFPHFSHNRPHRPPYFQVANVTNVERKLLFFFIFYLGLFLILSPFSPCHHPLV